MKKYVWLVWGLFVLVMSLEFQACNKAANPAFAVHPCSTNGSFGVASAASTATLGPCTVLASPYTTTASVDLYQFEAFSMVGGFNVGLYADKNGLPGNLVVSSGNVTGAGLNQAQTIAVNPIQLPPGVYWLALGSQTPVTVGINVGTTVVYGPVSCAANSLPSTFSPVSSSGGIVMSLKADYCQ